MNYLKSKKGILIEGTSIIIVFLLSTALVYLLWDNTEIDEELKVGQMLMDVYSVEEKSIKFIYNFEKTSEYSLLKGLKENINIGLLNGTGCNAFFELNVTEKCYIENLAEVFAKNISEKVSNHFKEDFDNSEYKLNLTRLIFETRNVGGKLFVIIQSDELVEFSKDINREMKYTVPIYFEVNLDFDFNDYENIFLPLRENLVCLDTPENIDSKSSSINNCLNAYPPFSNLRVENGILLFDYSMDGVLFERKIVGPLAVDLEGFKAAISIK